MIVFRRAYPQPGMPIYQGVTEFYEGQIVRLSDEEEKQFVESYFAEYYKIENDYYQPYDMVSDRSGRVTGVIGPNGFTSVFSSSDVAQFTSVKDFGAVGDGVTDDTAAIQTAFNTTAANRQTLFFPDGEYRCNGRLELKSNLSVRFSEQAVLLRAFDAPTAAQSFIFTSTSNLVRAVPTKITGGMVENVTWIGGKIIDATRSNFYRGDVMGIVVANSRFEGLEIQYFGGRPEAIGGRAWLWVSYNTIINGCKAMYSLVDGGTGGMRMVGGENTIISNCFVESGDDAFQFVSGAQEPRGNLDTINCAYINCTGESTAARVIAVSVTDESSLAGHFRVNANAGSNLLTVVEPAVNGTKLISVGAKVYSFGVIVNGSTVTEIVDGQTFRISTPAVISESFSPIGYQNEERAASIIPLLSYKIKDCAFIGVRGKGKAAVTINSTDTINGVENISIIGCKFQANPGPSPSNPSVNTTPGFHIRVGSGAYIKNITVDNCDFEGFNGRSLYAFQRPNFDAQYEFAVKQPNDPLHKFLIYPEFNKLSGLKISNSSFKAPSGLGSNLALSETVYLSVGNDVIFDGCRFDCSPLEAYPIVIGLTTSEAETNTDDGADEISVAENQEAFRLKNINFTNCAIEDIGNGAVLTHAIKSQLVRGLSVVNCKFAAAVGATNAKMLEFSASAADGQFIGNNFVGLQPPVYLKDALSLGYFNFLGNQNTESILSGALSVAGNFSTGGSFSAATLVGKLIGGGTLNTAAGTRGGVLAGNSNSAAAADSAIVGGTTNSVTGARSGIVGGTTNSVTAVDASVNSGVGNVVQITRSSVVSGNNNQIVPAAGQTAAGADHVICGGNNNLINSPNAQGVTINYAFVGGGLNNSASGSNAVIAGGSTNAVSGTNAVISGGLNNVANSNNSAIPGGAYATTNSILGQFAHGFSGAVLGQNQMTMTGLRRQTTNATAVQASANGAAGATTNQLTLRDNTAFRVEGYVTARSTAGDTKEWSINALIKRGTGAATTALVGTPNVTSNFADAGASAWAVTVTADTTNGAFQVNVQGAAATTIQWTVVLYSTEVMG